MASFAGGRDTTLFLAAMAMSCSLMIAEHIADGTDASMRARNVVAPV